MDYLKALVSDFSTGILGYLVLKLFEDNLPSFHRRNILQFGRTVASIAVSIYDILRFVLALGLLLVSVLGLLWLIKKIQVSSVASSVAVAVVGLCILGLGLEFIRQHSVAPKPVKNLS